MAKPLAALSIAAVMLCAPCSGLAEPFYGSDDAYGDQRFYRSYGDPYERHYRRDLFEELQREKDDRKMAELIKKFPSEDPIKANLQKRMEAIISTNFTANTNVAPMEIVPGLSGVSANLVD